MRTTLSVDDDVLLAVKERARRENRTAGEVLSDLARQALTQQQSCSSCRSSALPKNFYGFEPFEHRGAAVSNALIDRLRDEEAV
ncbi:MAG: antitoxin [Mycobacteriaceae bacterium]|nr:antitoxin [Mycobacteriaceae bacterium]